MRISSMVLAFLVLIVQVQAELDKKKPLDEAQSLRKLAAQRVAQTAPPDPNTEQTVFRSGALALQKLNPEISVTGDFLFSAQDDDANEKNSDFSFRTLGLHFESWLDPYTQFKGAVAANEDETVLGEAYFTLFNVADSINLTLGKFRQQFGVVNRWHKHGLDQVDFPLALQQIFGAGGLNQSGLSLDWLLAPMGETSHQLTLQVTDGSNDRVFAENAANNPSVLTHYKRFQDLSKDTYLEWGFTGMLGWNNKWDMANTTVVKDTETTAVLGADLCMLWEPTGHMRHRNIELRSEAYWLSKGIQAPDGSGSDRLNAWGLFSYIQSKIRRTVDIGIRGDYYVPDTKDYAGLSGLSLSPLAVTADDAYLCRIGPYVTWQQSPFVKFRAEFGHSDGQGIDGSQDVLWLQAVFAAGPHKHERY